VKLENRFRTRLGDRLKGALGSQVYIQKNHGNEYSSGLPDIFVQVHGFGHAHIELKAIEKVEAWNWALQPTKLQIHTLRQIYNAGGNVGVVLYVGALDVSLAVHGRNLFSLVDRGAVWERHAVGLAGVATTGVHPLAGAHALPWFAKSNDARALVTHILGQYETQ
jgi:hypothetical protein